MNPVKAPVTGLRKVYERLIRIRGEPRDISLGLALGIFIGLSPIFGIQIWSAILLAALFRWNKIAAAVGTLISNPFTTPFICAATYYVGSRLLGADLVPLRNLEWNLDTLVRILSKTPQVFWALTLGGIILGLPLALISYYICYTAVVRYRTRLKQKLADKRRQLRERLKRKRRRSPKRRQWSALQKPRRNKKR